MLEKLAAYSGLIASVWIVIGVIIAGVLYPGYSHSRQFCSELGASGSPTQSLSPLINNYPLGIFFCLFGGYLAARDDVSMLVVISGWLIIVHGIGTWVAGFFPMDADPYTKEPSVKCEVHAGAGVVMLLSLLIAPILVGLSPPTAQITPAFKLFSYLCSFVSVGFLFGLIKAFNARTNPGTYQRLSYGAQLLWLGVFSFMLG